jgi:acetyl esterase/lipase
MSSTSGKRQSTEPTPLVFVIHGGGWQNGDKDRTSRFVDLPRLLQEGISVASINYRFIKQAEAEGVAPPVKAPLHDAAQALQFVRSKAKEWNLDPVRIGATGGSAGACSSLWLAFHDDLADAKSSDPVARESTRLFCAAVTGAQTTLDPRQMKDWTPNSRYGGHAFGRPTFTQFLAEREQIVDWIAEYSPYALVSADDPPVYLIYTSPPALGQDQKDPTHTSNFGVKLQDHCKAQGVACELVYPNAPDVKHATPSDYLIATLKGAPANAAAQPKAVSSAEPTTAEEAAAQKAKAEAELEVKYQALVATLPPDQQAWEQTLQSQLGSFYLPIHKREKVAGKSNAWDFVQDDPKLPRVLLIGDSVSRGYTQAVRQALQGTANVHRAPANCGPTASGLKHLDVWLGEGKWDIIHFNFGIHDRNTPIADYSQRLEQIVARLQKTGARVIWGSTTPIPDTADGKQTAASIVERNRVAAEIMQRHQIAIDDLFAAITPHLAELQNPNDVHFNAKGYEFLGQQVAASIRQAVKSSPIRSSTP